MFGKEQLPECRMNSPRVFRIAAVIAALSAFVAFDASAKSSVDSQFDSIRARVMAHSAEVHKFEKDLLQPVDTRVAVFLTLASRNELDVDAVELFIDGQPVTAHLYSARERASLERGGVQQLFTGNLTNGMHELKLVFSVRNAKDQFVRREAIHQFHKQTGTYRMQLVLEARAPDYEPSVNVMEWK